jgi:hypothetical protein
MDLGKFIATFSTPMIDDPYEPRIISGTGGVENKKALCNGTGTQVPESHHGKAPRGWGTVRSATSVNRPLRLVFVPLPLIPAPLRAARQRCSSGRTAADHLCFSQ